MRFLFVSYAQKNCGVYQFGQGVYRALSAAAGESWECADVLSVAEIDAAVERVGPDVILYNWHGGTLGAITHPNCPRRYPCVNVALMHELTPAEASALPRNFFQLYVVADPTFPNNIEQVRPLPRCIPKWLPEKRPELPGDDRPAFGAFGFSVASKGWEYLPGTIEREYEHSRLRLHIPVNWAMDPSGERARFVVRSLQALVRKDTLIEADYELLTPERLLFWLASNTANLFTYYPQGHSGISSATDWAIAAGRPFGVSPSGLFKHLQHLPIIIGYRLLKEIVADGDRWAKQLQEEWSEINFVSAFHNAIGVSKHV